jgi:hypothetical protein
MLCGAGSVQTVLKLPAIIIDCRPIVLYSHGSTHTGATL